jgi:hypothetical protein
VVGKSTNSEIFSDILEQIQDITLKVISRQTSTVIQSTSGIGIAKKFVCVV